jgi:hypothetical protein
LDLAAAFVPAPFHGRVDEKILQGPEQERTEAAAVRIGCLQQAPFDDHEEEILGQVLRILFRVTATIDKGKNGPPIDLAELGQGRINLGFGSGRCAEADQAPARGDEMRQSSRTLNSTRISHPASLLGWLPSLKENRQIAD